MTANFPIGKFGVTITPNLPIWADIRPLTAYNPACQRITPANLHQQ
jgi:hypothetical protein